MKLYIIGDNHDDKGKQLEELTAAILKECGYEYVCLNTIEAGGSEIDVKAKLVYDIAGTQKEIPVICECKAKNDTITINDGLKFVGKVSIARMNNAWKTIKRDIAAMQKMGVLIHDGNTSAGHWVIVQK